MSPRIPAHVRAAAAKLVAQRRAAAPTPAVPLAFGAWLAQAKPHHVWTARHFQAMQAVLDQMTAGILRRIYFQIPIRHGKALALDTPIPTPTGWARMGDLQVGDWVYGDDGAPVQVTWRSPIFRDRRVFRVTTDDGDVVLADEAHEWAVAITPGARVGTGRGAATTKTCDRVISIHETQALAARQARGMPAPCVRAPGALQASPRDLPLDPYVLGVWLGDGTSQNGGVTIGHRDQPALLAQLRACGVTVTPHTDPIGFTIRGIRAHLVALGVLGQKHIPAAYLRAAVDQRRALLQGLIDTDGYVAPDGQVEFCATNHRLATEVQELVRSLGVKASLIEGRATLHGVDHGPKYRVMFYMAGAARLPRKAVRCRDSHYRTGRYLTVAEAGRADTICVEVGNASHLFLCGRSMTPTRNTEHNTIGYAAYRLERDPATRILVCSYNDRRAQKFSRDIRKLVQTRGVAISSTRDSAGDWETDAGGGVFAVGAGSGVASVNADLILIDDPIGSRDDAESPAKRDQVWDWMTNDILARCEPHTGVLMTMSRWHTDDPAGRLIDQQANRWTILDFPAEAEDMDPLGRAYDEPLWPELRGAAWLEEKREELGAYGFASLLQGRPRPREGGMFKWAWWRLVDTIPAQGPMVRYWDLASTEGRRGGGGDWTVGALCCRQLDKRTAVVDIARFQRSSAERDAEMERIAAEDRALYGFRVRWWIETEVGDAGKARTMELVRRLQSVGLSVSTEHPTGKKILRAEPLASKAEVGNIVLCPGKWRDPFRAEGATFPNGKHDDQIDAVAGADSKLVTRSTLTVQVHSF